MRFSHFNYISLKWRQLIIAIIILISFNQRGLSQSYQEINIINEQAFKLRSSNRDSSRVLGYQALKASHQIDYNKGKALAQLNLGIHYCNGNTLDSASRYLRKSLSYLKALDDPHNLAINNWYMGKLYQKLGNFKKAFHYLDATEKIFREQNNLIFLIYVLTERGVYHEMQDEYTKALEYYLEIYDLIIKLDRHKETKVFGNIANVYTSMGNYTDALKYAKKSYNLAKDSKQYSLISSELLIVGNVYFKLNNHDSALFYYNLGLENAILSKRNNSQAHVLARIANVYSSLKKIQKSNTYLLQAKPLGDDLSLLEIYALLSENYTALLLNDSAVFYMHKSVEIATRRGSKNHLVLVFEKLMNHYRNDQNYERAFYYAELLKKNSDLMYNEKKNKSYNDLRVQIETFEKENEIQSLKFEQYETRIKNSFVISFIILAVLIAIVIFMKYKSSQAKKQKLLEIRQVELENQLEKSKKKLSNHTLSMIQRNNTLEEIKTELSEVKSRCNGTVDKGLQKINTIISLNKSLENDWANFSNLFTEIHNGFFTAIEQKFSHLSQNEIKLCALIKLKLTNKEIATILNIEYKSVKMAKYRLKKNLKLSKEMNLAAFVAQY